MQRITPCLWFDDNAEEAVRFYTSIFKGGRVKAVTRYGEAAAKASGQPEGSVMTVAFELDGQDFLALNGGPVFKFTPAISLMANCRTQQEIDELWAKLSAGGRAEQCGWLTDRYGVSWQVVPANLGELVGKDPAATDRVMEAILGMTKLDMAALERAAGGAR